MAGRPKSEQSEEKREHRTVIRWTKTEKDKLTEVRKKLGLPYDVDVVRLLTLQGADELLAQEQQIVAE